MGAYSRIDGKTELPPESIIKAVFYLADGRMIHMDQIRDSETTNKFNLEEISVTDIVIRGYYTEPFVPCPHCYGDGVVCTGTKDKHKVYEVCPDCRGKRVGD